MSSLVLSSKGKVVEEIQCLIADILQHRGRDTIVAFHPRADSTPTSLSVIDQFVARNGLSAIGDQWREISREAAVSLAATFLVRDLAYSVQLMQDHMARELADRFVIVFSADARFFTNTEYAAGASSWGWMPLTESTFDAGIVGADPSTIGVLVVQDED